MTPRALGLILLALVAGCSGASAEHDFVELGIEISNEAGARGSVSCEALPVLPGSRRYTEHDVAGAFTLVVFSSPSEVSVSFESGGRTLEAPRRIARDALAGDYEETLPLVLEDGSRYDVTLSSRCEP